MPFKTVFTPSGASLLSWKKQKQKKEKAKTKRKNKKQKKQKQKTYKNIKKESKMENKKQNFNLQIIGEKIKSAIKRNAFRELIVLENKDIESTLDSVYLIRKEYAHLINSIWLHDKFIVIRVAAQGQISWCELVDKRTSK